MSGYIASNTSLEELINMIEMAGDATPREKHLFSLIGDVKTHAELMDEVEGLEDEVSSLESENEGLIEDKAELKREIARLEKEVSKLEAELEEANRTA